MVTRRRVLASATSEARDDFRMARHPPGIRGDEADSCNPLFEFAYSFRSCIVFSGELWVSYEGYGIRDRDYPRAVCVVDDAFDVLANHL